MLNILCELAFCLSFVILMLVIPGYLTGILTLGLTSRKKPRRRGEDTVPPAPTAGH